MYSMLDIEKEEIAEIKSLDIYSILSMIGNHRSIIIDKNIGLLVIDDNENDVNSKYSVSTISNLIHDKIKLGNEFQVIDKEGCILFDIPVKSTGIIVIGADTVGYCFKLSDYYDIDPIGMIIGNEYKRDAIIIYYDNKLFARSNYENKLPNNIIIDNTIEFKSVDNTDILTFNNNTYISSPIDVNNNIFQYRLHNEGDKKE